MEHIMGDLFAVSGLMILPVLVVFIYPVITLIQCWMNKELTSGPKIGWTIAILLSWPFYGIGAFGYGLVQYKSHMKAVPGIVAIVVIASFSLGSDKAFDLQYDISQTMVDTMQLPAEHKSLLTEQITTLRNEGGSIEIERRSLVLNAHLSHSLEGGLTQEEFEYWSMLYQNRANLNREDLLRIAQAAEVEAFLDY